MNNETNQKMEDYSTKFIQVGKIKWSIVFAPDYISIRKETSNPWKMSGRRFKDLHEAIDTYKNINMKVALMQCL